MINMTVLQYCLAVHYSTFLIFEWVLCVFVCVCLNWDAVCICDALLCVPQICNRFSKSNAGRFSFFSNPPLSLSFYLLLFCSRSPSLPLLHFALAHHYQPTHRPRNKRKFVDCCCGCLVVAWSWDQLWVFFFFLFVSLIVINASIFLLFCCLPLVLNVFILCLVVSCYSFLSVRPETEFNNVRGTGICSFSSPSSHMSPIISLSVIQRILHAILKILTQLLFRHLLALLFPCVIKQCSSKWEMIRDSPLTIKHRQSFRTENLSKLPTSEWCMIITWAFAMHDRFGPFCCPFPNFLLADNGENTQNQQKLHTHYCLGAPKWNPVWFFAVGLLLTSATCISFPYIYIYILPGLSLLWWSGVVCIVECFCSKKKKNGRYGYIRQRNVSIRRHQIALKFVQFGCCCCSDDRPLNGYFRTQIESENPIMLGIWYDLTHI